MRVSEQFESSKLAGKGSNGGKERGYELPHAAFPLRWVQTCNSAMDNEIEN